MSVIQIKLRRGTTAEWAASNPVLALGEPGVDTTLDQIKIGDGTTAWASLPFSTLKPADITDLTDAGATTLHSHATADHDHTAAAGDGGTIPSSSVTGGLLTMVGTPYNGVGLTGDLGITSLLASGHPAGFYAILFYGRCTTAGTSGSTCAPYIRSHDGVGVNQSGAWSSKEIGTSAELTFPLVATTTIRHGIVIVYSSGSAALEILVNGTYNGSPVYTFRARVAYIGA